ncbi:diguanylate cyclase [Chitinibacter bivalviorum]|uniref:diguanylate cyclase n=1 Tax=Chitinibacter bivalviorum TaxID=2739434 RepID=A0A7H9BF18_9NEIS|nr:diguanylate cyclase [Chitinibacter bivalviorum]QLG87155.1 diguanylate cyclase [Chitinibacter bivalviorum]
MNSWQFVGNYQIATSMFDFEGKESAVILIIDDSRMNQMLLSAMLKEMGQIHCANHGEEGVMLAQTLHPNVILLDVEMPGMNGFEVCKMLKQQPNFESAIIFVTAHSGSEHEVRALDAGAVDFITKPFHDAVVKARVSAHLLLNLQTHYLRNLVNLDGLTGVFNRRHFDEMLAQEWRRHLRAQQSLALALLDVDFFKRYNDALGHQAGDDCLKAVAHCLAKSTKRPGEIVTRYGGEEFAIILPNTSQEEVLGFGHYLCQQIAALQLPHPDRPDLPFVTISVGLSAVLPTLQSEPKSLIAAADAALYRAKEQGRNQACLGKS